MTKKTPNSNEPPIPGPTACDEKRSEREVDLEKVEAIMDERMIADTHILFGDVYDLLKEAMSCYQNGVFLATTLVCRTAVESAVYIAVSRSLHIAKFDFLMSESVSIDYKFRDAKRKEMLDLARKKGLLDA